MTASIARLRTRSRRVGVTFLHFSFCPEGGLTFHTASVTVRFHTFRSYLMHTAYGRILSENDDTTVLKRLLPTICEARGSPLLYDED